MSETTETEEEESWADMVLKSAPPEAKVRFVCVVVLCEYDAEFALQGGSRGQLYAVDASCTTASGKVDPSLGTAVSVLRQLADQTEEQFKAAGFATVSVAPVEPGAGPLS